MKEREREVGAQWRRQRNRGREGKARHRRAD